MIIKQIKRETKTTKDFCEREWAKADLEHFDRRVDWKKEKVKLVALEGKEIVGWLSGDIEAKTLRIKQLLVAKDKRGLGIGTGLLQAAEKIAKKSKAHEIFLETGEKWQSVMFYKRLGYKIAARLPNHYFHQNHVIFTKFLN